MAEEDASRVDMDEMVRGLKEAVLVATTAPEHVGAWAEVMPALLADDGITKLVTDSDGRFIGVFSTGWQSETGYDVIEIEDGPALDRLRGAHIVFFTDDEDFVGTFVPAGQEDQAGFRSLIAAPGLEGRAGLERPADGIQVQQVEYPMPSDDMAI